jgi:hypothetical protein
MREMLVVQGDAGPICAWKLSQQKVCELAVNKSTLRAPVGIPRSGCSTWDGGALCTLAFHVAYQSLMLAQRSCFLS